MTIGKTEFDALLEEIRKIANALTNPRSRALSNEPPAGAAAASNIDYLVLRQLMGRIRRDGEPVVIFSAARRKGSGSHPVLTLGSVPEDAEKLAVFTQRGDPAEVVALSGHPTPYTATSKPVEYQLTTVTNEQVITRLEFRRADDYPLALGPRLAVV
jgi:hypothetical protein